MKDFIAKPIPELFKNPNLASHKAGGKKAKTVIERKLCPLFCMSAVGNLKRHLRSHNLSEADAKYVKNWINKKQYEELEKQHDPSWDPKGPPPALEDLMIPDPDQAERQLEGSGSARVKKQKKIRICVLCREKGTSEEKQKTSNITMHFKRNHQDIFEDKEEYNKIRESCPYICPPPSVEVQCNNRTNKVEDYIKHWLSFEATLTEYRKTRYGNTVKEFLFRSIGDEMQHDMSFELLDVSI